MAHSPEMNDEITTLLNQWQEGDPGGLTALFPRILGELRQIARRHLVGERTEISLEPTDLVGEIYLKMKGTKRVKWEDREHFFNFASTLIRRILIDRSRRRTAKKRPEHFQRVPMEELDLEAPQGLEPEMMVALDQALTRLGELDSRQAKIVRFRFFVGLTIPEMAEALGLSKATVKRELRQARLWLAAELLP